METFKKINIEIMLNKSIVGKAPLEWDRNDWRQYYRAFKRTRLTPYVMAAKIWEGYSFTPCYRNGRRIEENFDVAYHMAFDFDQDGAALDFLMRPGTLAHDLASFAYSTPSSTAEQPKSRVVFILPQGITDPQQFRKLYQAIAKEFAHDGSQTDPACKDPLRLYYGSYHCDMVTNWSALLPPNIDWLIDRYEAENPPPKKLVDATVIYQTDDDIVQSRLEHELEKIVLAPDGEKHTTLNKVAYTVGGYVGAGHLSEYEAVDKLKAAIRANGRAEDLQAAERTIESAVLKGSQRPLVIESKVKKDGPEIL